ncbi:hypothetical protein AX16_006780 [Volvariella volvacea WC 439]|nr:hypothetical protein AX16_006780 [Volvariella volvacea WC 439]
MDSTKQQRPSELSPHPRPSVQLQPQPPPQSIQLPPLNVSLPSSPRSSALPSPPDSPSSVSSFPSVSSSFFFSSAAASPPHPFGVPLPHPHLHNLHHAHSGLQSIRDDPSYTQGLIIPSLTLPSALRRPTFYGQTLGDLRLLVLGAQGAGRHIVEGLLLEENEHIIEVGEWEDYFSQDPIDDADAAESGLVGQTLRATPDGGIGLSTVKVIRASTDWVEHRDAHGLEKFEPMRNVELIEVSGYDPAASPADVQELLDTLKSVIRAPFQNVAEVLHPDHKPSAVLANLVSSPFTPLFTALIFLLPTAPTPVDHQILKGLSSEIPIIVLPRLSSHSSHSRPLSRKPSNLSQPSHPQPKFRLSTFQPSSAIALRTGLFNSPETLALLRSEATDRFLSWREVEREVEIIRQKRAHDPVIRRDALHWNKVRWEAEWESELSVQVARRLKEDSELSNTIRQSLNAQQQQHQRSPLATAVPISVYQQRESDHGTTSSSDSSLSSSAPPSPSIPFSTLKNYDALDNMEYGYDLDPLHFPSLVMFSLALLNPLQQKIGRTINKIVEGTFGQFTGKTKSAKSAQVLGRSDAKSEDGIQNVGRRRDGYTAAMRNRGDASPPAYEEGELALGGYYGSGNGGPQRPGPGIASIAVGAAVVFSAGVGVGMWLK